MNSALLTIDGLLSIDGKSISNIDVPLTIIGEILPIVDESKFIRLDGNPK